MLFITLFVCHNRAEKIDSFRRFIHIPLAGLKHQIFLEKHLSRDSHREHPLCLLKCYKVLYCTDPFKKLSPSNPLGDLTLCIHYHAHSVKLFSIAVHTNTVSVNTKCKSFIILAGYPKKSGCNQLRKADFFLPVSLTKIYLLFDLFLFFILKPVFYLVS